MRILCVDDEPLALQMLELSIKKAKPDAEVLGFDEPEDLLAEAEKNSCDIAFLDIHMSEMDGVEAAKRLKEINPKMNIIFVTGFSEYTGDAMRLHASGYIMKPVTKEKVAAELDDLILCVHDFSLSLHVQIGFRHFAHHHGVCDHELGDHLCVLCPPGNQNVDIHDHFQSDLMLGLIDARGDNVVLKLHMGGREHQDLHRDTRSPSHQQAYTREIAQRDAHCQGSVFRCAHHFVENLR